MTEVGGGVQAITEVKEHRTDDVDLRIFVKKGGRGDRTILSYELQFADEPREALSSLETQLDLHTFFTEFWAKFNRLVGSGSEAQKSYGWLSDKSAYLTRQVLPEDLQERLWELRDDVETVQIHSEEGWIPWELLQLRQRTARGTWKPGRFLGEAFSMTRWHGPHEATRGFSLKRIGCLIAAADELPYMTREASDLRLRWEEAKCAVEDLPNDLDALRHRLSQAVLDGLHVIGHGHFRGQKTGSVSIDLGQAIQGLDPEILDGDAGNVGSSHPLVFFNTCHSARGGQALIDINSWAAGFIRAGAGAFIGASWPIDDQAAYLFATTFYEGFFGGLPIGKAVSNARAEVKDQRPGDPTWLAYVVYAHPLAVYQRAREELEAPIVRKERRSRLAIAARPVDRTDPERLEGVLESVCAQAKKSLGVAYRRYPSGDGELPSFGFASINEAHDFAVELLEALHQKRLHVGDQGPYLSIALAESLRSPSDSGPAVETTPEHISSLGPTGHMVIDTDTWSRLSGDRQSIYGAEELVRPPTRLRAIHIRRARVTGPAPEEIDLVKLHDGKGLDPADPPYIGPDFFSDASRGFFGRSREIRDLCEKIERNDYTLVYAASGAGKSSLVHTGVPGHLDSDQTECILVRYYLPSERIADRDPDIFFACIRDKLKELFGREQARATNRLAAGGGSLADLLAGLSWPTGRKRVLIIDQFENSLLKDDALDYMNVAKARENFFHQLRLALREFEIKLVLVFREEYLAKIKDLCRPIRKSGLNGGEFYLKNLDARAALEVIRNHARMVGVDYEDGLAEKIVEQLSKNKEIAPVQLQVVCRMIWENLTGKEGTKVITSTDVASVGGSGSSGSMEDLNRHLQEFIKNSVQQFYYRKLKKIAAEEREVKIDVDLLHIGCMEFVSSSSHHDALEREGTKVGRLPEAIVKRLEDEYLIRRVEMEGKSFYELIHDTVAEAISAGGQQLQVADWQAKLFDKDPNKLLYALKSLEFLVKRYKSEISQEEGSESPVRRRRRQDERASFRKGLFVEHDEMLKSIEGFQKRPGLFDDEAEFVLRCVLASDKDFGYQKDWARNIANEYPNVFNRVLLEAIRLSGEDLAAARERQNDEDRHEGHQEKAGNIRRNAVLLAGAILEYKSSARGSLIEEGVKNINDSIVICALEDKEASVWQAAAASLAKLNPETFATVLTEKLASSSGDRLNRIYDILAQLGEISYARHAVLTPAKPWPQLDLRSRIEVFSRMWRRRMRKSLQLLATALVLSILLIPLFTATLRAPLAWKGLTQTQAENGFFQGVFHSVAAGTGWAFTVTLPVLIYWILFEKEGKPDRRLKRRKWLPALIGGIGGFVGGLIASSFAMFVFTTPSLQHAGWLDPTDWADLKIKPPFFDLLKYVVGGTRFGWVFPITGTCIGAGVSLLIASVGCHDDWLKFTKKESDEGLLTGDPSRLVRIFLTIVGMIVKKRYILWPLVLTLGGGLISYWLLDPGAKMRPEYRDMLLFRSLCDALSMVAGGIGLAVAVLFSFIVDAAGVKWENRGRRSDDSWNGADEHA